MPREKKLTPSPKVGDRVRVVLEGEAKYVGKNGELSVGNEGGAIHPYSTTRMWWPHVVSVEILPRPLKVGDVIQLEQYETAPLGTVVTDSTSRMGWFRTNTGWVNLNGGTHLPSDMRHSPQAHTVVYLPAAAK